MHTVVISAHMLNISGTSQNSLSGVWQAYKMSSNIPCLLAVKWHKAQKCSHVTTDLVRLSGMKKVFLAV